MAMPKHPKGSTVRTDELGTYIHFHRRCKVCEAELTSRNRPTDGSLKCKECIQVTARQVYEADHPRPVKETPTPEITSDLSAVKATRLKKPPGGAERQAIHHLLTAFLARPTIKDHKDALMNALLIHELQALWPR